MHAIPHAATGCAGFRAAVRLRRREVLRIGGLFGLGLTLPGLLRSRAVADPAERGTFGRAKRVIMLFLHGGHPQQETFDPKPEGPVAVRGEFGAIATSLPGVQFSELLPKSAAVADRLAVIRSMSHENANHVQACLPANTGHKHPPSLEKRGDFPPADTDFPPFGAVLDSLRPAQGNLPTWVRVGPLMRRNNGTVLHGQTPGLLGPEHASFAIDQDLLSKNVRIEVIQPQDDLSSVRLIARRGLLEQFDRQRRLIDQTAEAQTLDAFYGRAFNLLSSPATRKAFELAAEPPQVRARYGATEFGQRCLLARRLAEAGVPMVNVSYCHTPKGSWDTHAQNFRDMKRSLAPTFDAAFTALMGDLEERGLLQDTLVVVNAEFGRTPQINKNAGRDHWPWVYSLVLAGAGIRAGTVYGSSDSSAAYPASNPHGPEDFAATIYHLLGVAPEAKIYDRLDRPHQLIVGASIAGVLA
jgi:hypothetical protein